MSIASNPSQILNVTLETGRVQSPFFPINTQTYFAVEATDDYLYPEEFVYHRQLWVSDATTGGTHALSHGGTVLAIAGNIGNQLYFFTYEQTPDASGTPVGGAYLWVTDGTDAGTRRISGPNPGTFYTLKTAAEMATIVDGQLFFPFGNDGAFEPWRSDGTPEGTHSLGNLQPDLPPITVADGSSPQDFVVLGDRILFSARTDATGRELWVSQGNLDDAQLLLDIGPRNLSGLPTPLGIVGDRLVFQAQDRATGRELWVTDGTTAGTRLLADMNPGPDSSLDIFSQQVYTPDGKLLFFADDTVGDGVDLWVTDGTTGGTQKLWDANFVNLSAGTIAVGNQIFFAGDRGLGVTDGTVAGTRFLADVGFEGVDRPPDYTRVVPGILNGKALFRSADSVLGGSELWISDGTVAGTTLLQDLNPTGSSRPFNFFTANDRMFFCANGNELWVTDGTATGTHRLLAGVSFEDFVAKEEGNEFYETIPTALTPLDGKLYFTAYDLTHGFELWTTDGTAGGTAIIADLTPGADSSYPRDLMVLNGQLMFTTETGVWALDPSGEEAPVLSGAGGQRRFTIRAGDGTVDIADFGGIGRGDRPPAAVRAEVDTLRFVGPGLEASRLLLHQQDSDLVLTFEGIADTRVVLQDFSLENLDNLASPGVRLGNLLFRGQSLIQDSLDVWNAQESRHNLQNRNTVTFLNDRANRVWGFNHSEDIINGQGGHDWIDGRSGDDRLRGGWGHDTLTGGEGDDRLVGNEGADTFQFAGSRPFQGANLGVDTLVDFDALEGDRIGLDRSVFRHLRNQGGNALHPQDFAIVSRNADVAGSTAAIVYNTTNGRLFYNENGSRGGLGSGGLFAVLAGSPDLSRSDFTVQA